MLAAVLVVVALGIVAVLFSGRLLDRVIFQPQPGGDDSPDTLGIEASDVWLDTTDGIRIHAYWLPAQAQSLDLSLLFLHGNAGNASHRLPNAARLAQLGVDVLLLDYRGYGRSEGTPSEAGVQADARAGMALLRARGRADERIVVFGRSLGGAIAVELAAGRPLAGLVLESTFSSVADLAKATLGFGLGPVTAGRFAPDRRIGAIQSPLLFIHGDRDRIVPLELGERLFRRAPEPKSFERIRGAGHNDLVMVGGAAYFERIRSFLREVSGVMSR